MPAGPAAAAKRATSAVRMAGEDDDQIRSTVAVAHGALFVRTNDKLFCLAEPTVTKAGER